jgi:hypothetical protein
MDNSYHGGTAYSNNSNSNDSLYNLDSNNDSTESNYSDTSFKMV